MQIRSGLDISNRCIPIAATATLTNVTPIAWCPMVSLGSAQLERSHQRAPVLVRVVLGFQRRIARRGSAPRRFKEPPHLRYRARQRARAGLLQPAEVGLAECHENLEGLLARIADESLRQAQSDTPLTAADPQRLTGFQ